MARRPRLFIPGLSVHVIQRGNNRQSIFTQRADYEVFLAFLQAASMRHGVAVHGYALMTNHTHIIATPDHPAALPQTMKELSGRYVQYYNRKYERIGTLWSGRHRALLIGDERYWLTCLRYVEQNPVRAQMVRSADVYPWSSYRVHALGADTDWLVPHRVYVTLGHSSEERQTAYRALFDSPLTEAEIAQQRQQWGQTGVRRGSDPGPDPRLTP
jgi:putative transposase